MGDPHTPEALKAARREAGKVVDTVCFDKGWGFRDALIEAIAPLILLKDAALAAHQQVTAEREARGEVIASLVDELARLRAEGEAKDRALLLLLPFVDYAAGEGLAFVETEDGEHPEMDAADIMGFAAQALGLELGSDAYLALLPAGYDAIRAARAATAREGA